MLAELFAWLRGRRRPRATAPDEAAPARAPTAPPQPPTLTDILRAMVESLGDAPDELARERWMALADRIIAVSAAMPPPPSFPRIATQVLALARDPTVDVNELVGLVQRDGGIASTLVRIANSPAFGPAVPIATLRGAIGSLGLGKVVEIVVGSAGRSYYDVASTIELGLFPELWHTMFNDAMANAFCAGRLALDVADSSGESALFAGLLADVGRPIALRILTGLVRDGLEPPADPIVLATLDEVATRIGERAVASMDLPEVLRAACILDPIHPAADAQIARLVASIGAIQRRSPRIWENASDARQRAEGLHLGPYELQAVFAQRTQYALQAEALFGTRR